MRVKFGNATKDVPLLEVTPENYIVPVGEENTYHCRIEQIQFNSKGKRLSRPRIQKFEPKMYPSIARNLRQMDFDIVVLYDPTEYLKAKEAERAEMQSMTLQQRKEREAAQKAKEKAELKAEILAELKAAGMLKAPKEPKAPKAPKTDGAAK